MYGVQYKDIQDARKISLFMLMSLHVEMSNKSESKDTSKEVFVFLLQETIAYNYYICYTDYNN